MGRATALAVAGAALLAGTLAIAVHTRRPAGSTAWQEGADGYRAATMEAERAHAPLLLFFHTEWCGYCKRLERELFPAQPVAAQLRQVLRVRLNPERSPEERAIADRYGVRGYPSLIVERGTDAVRLHPFTFQGGAWLEASPEAFVAELKAAER